MAIFQSVLKFDGQDDSVRIGAINLASASFTVEFWAQRAEANKSHFILSQGESQPNKGLHIGFRDNNFFTIGFYGGNDLNSSSTYTDNLWHHWCCTYNQTNKEQIIYCDGRQVARRTVKDDYQGKGDLFSGTYLDNFGWFKGQLTEVRLWNRDRTAEEIQQDMYRSLIGDEPGLLGYWPLSEGSGDQVLDKSDRKNNGTIKGAIWQQQIFIKSPEPSVNYFSSALKFDGVDDHIVLPAMNVDYSGGITIEAWVRFNSFKPHSRIVDFGNGQGSSNILLYNQGTKNDLVWNIFRGSSRSSIWVEGLLEIGKWMHIAATVDSAGKAKIYANGELIKTGDIALPESINRTNNYIAKSNWSSDGYFDGQIAEVRHWNRERTQQEIQQNLYRRLAGNEANLVGYWPLDEGAGSTVVTDRSVSANHGTINGGATWQQQIFIQPIAVKPTEAKDNTQSVLSFDGKDDYVEIPGKCVPTGNEITVTFWAYGGSSLPQQTSILEAVVKGNARLLNIHLPWSDGRVFFDCGGDGSSYDRIEKGAPVSEYKGKWTHWAFTKNAATGEMKIYLNGELWHSGDNKKMVISQAEKLALGYSPSARQLGYYGCYYHGMMQELRIWNRTLLPEEIQKNMYRRLVGNEAGLVGYWPLNEGSGTTTSDKTNGGNHGKITSATWEQQIFLQPTKETILFQNVLAFDGQDDYVEIPYTASLNPSQFTLSCWVKVQGGQGSYRSVITSREAYPQKGYILYAGDNNKWQFWIGADKAGWVTVIGSDVILNAWTHLGATCDGNKLKFYINGELAGESTGNYVANTARPLRIGAGSTEGNPSYFLPGEIANVSIWNRVLSKEEIKQQMDVRLVGNELGLVGYWPLNEGAGNTAADKSSLANHGQIKGGAIWHRQLFLASAQPSTLLPTETTIRFKPVLAFDGKTACINLGKKPAFKIEQTITLEAWVFAEKLEILNGIISSIFDIGLTESGYGLVIDGKGSVYLGIKPTSGGLQYAPSSPGALKLNEWHHLAGTYDGQRMKVYVDGVEKGTQTMKALRINYEPENDLLIGMYKDNNQTRPFQGKILEVRLWNRVRSPEELQKDMNRYLQGNEPGLVGYWPLNEGSGTTVSDKTSQGNQGIINGAIWQQ